MSVKTNTMRPHNRAFVRATARHLECPGPIFEFGALQVEDRPEIADLRDLFPGRRYVGCDVRPGRGVDRVDDVTAPNLPDNAAGTVLCIETFEHVFEIHRAFAEVFRILSPGGIFILTCPFYFHLHGYPDDYWRLTPSCLRRHLAPYAGRIVGWQGRAGRPHTVMASAVKAPAPRDGLVRAERLIAEYQAWLRERARTGLAAGVCRSVRGLFQSRAERQQIRGHYRAEFWIDLE